MFKVLEKKEGEALHLLVEGTITKADVEEAARCCDEYAKEQEDKISLVMELREFKGYTISAFLADFKFGMTHLDTFSRIALVGDNKLEEIMAKVTDTFVKYEVKYFDLSRLEEAKQWARPKVKV